MAKSHYSADSVPLLLPRLLFNVPSDTTGSSGTPLADAAATAGNAFSHHPLSIG